LRRRARYACYFENANVFFEIDKKVFTALKFHIGTNLTPAYFSSPDIGHDTLECRASWSSCQPCNKRLNLPGKTCGMPLLENLLRTIMLIAVSTHPDGKK